MLQEKKTTEDTEDTEDFLYSCLVTLDGRWRSTFISVIGSTGGDGGIGMRVRRRVIVYIATSADGYIARPDGDVEWLNRRPRADYGMRAFYPTIDTILLGRKTYDWALTYQRKSGMKGGVFDTNVANYVFTSTPPKRTAPGVTFVSEPVQAFARRLRRTPGKHIWLMGGGELIASFLDAGEIDEFDIHVIPVFIGEGIPLVAPRHRDIALRLRSARKYPDGVVRLRYEVVK